MSFLERIRECNRFDVGRFVPLAIGGRAGVGALRRDRASRLEELGAPVERRGPGLTLRGRDSDAWTRALDECCDLLVDAGDVRGRLGERFSVLTAFGAEPCAEVDRALVAWFGFRAFGVHMNGFVRGADASISMWVATRSRSKPTFAGMLDNLVAGGQPAGIGVFDNLLKECEEEASIPLEVARRARPVGAISYCVEQDVGLKPDTMFVFDLELPSSFEPRPGDGEVESFTLLPLHDVAAIVRDSTRFKFNCNLVVIDFLVRHGELRPEHPDYLAIVQGLRQPFCGFGDG